MRLYFRDIEVLGPVPDEHTQGRLLAANHVNALVDPILVLTSTQCPVSPIAKSTLWDIPGMRLLLDIAGAVPVVRRRDNPDKSAQDNDAIFARIASHMGKGGNVLIFPEGTSHNEPHLVPLKTGAGRMLARAESEGARELSVQAVALEFDARDIFRSRCLVLFGPVRYLRDLHDGKGDRPQQITDVLRQDLSELLVEGPTWEARLLSVRVAELYAHEAGERSLANYNTIGRRVEEAHRLLSATDPKVVAEATAKVDAYYTKLAELGLTDDLVAYGERRISTASPVHKLGLLLLTPLAMLGLVLYALPYQLPRAISRRIGGHGDVASTYKLGLGLLVYPLWLAALLGVSFGLLRWPQALGAATLSVAAPFAALLWLDQWDRFVARARLLTPGSRAHARLGALRQERAALLAYIEDLRGKLGLS
jgi:1-acyl-sn-glycerol-3-phosphate acyltransferase